MPAVSLAFRYPKENRASATEHWGNLGRDREPKGGLFSGLCSQLQTSRMDCARGLF